MLVPRTLCLRHQTQPPYLPLTPPQPRVSCTLGQIDTEDLCHRLQNTRQLLLDLLRYRLHNLQELQRRDNGTIVQREVKTVRER
jgi:hypothetical protein